MLSDQCQILTIYDLPAICCITLNRAATPTTQNQVTCSQIGTAFDSAVYTGWLFLMLYNGYLCPLEKLMKRTKNDENCP